MIPHSGTVSVDGAPFNGPGQFKFAIINKGCITGVGCVFHWTNEKNSDPPEIEPATWITLTVTNGIFGIKLGDIALANNNAANMPEIPVSVFSDPATYLRIWFNDGQHNFQLLAPDRQLVSVPYAYRAEVANSVVGINQTASTGNVGIGTTNPADKLHVSGNVLIEHSGAGLDLRRDGYDEWLTGQIGNGLSIKNQTDDRTDLLINQIGNVGIGTTSPGFKLEVNTNSPDIAMFRHTATGKGGFLALRAQDIPGLRSIALESFDGPDSGFSFRTWNASSSSTVDRMVITKDGNVGIGTTVLHVVGSAMLQGDQNAIHYRDTAGTLRFLTGLRSDEAPVSDFVFYSYGGNWIFKNGTVGIRSPNPQRVLDVNGTAGGISDWEVISDFRYKTNISTLSTALDKVRHLRGVNFDWRRDEFPDLNFRPGRQVGLIAQEVKEVLPEVVFEDSQGMQSVAYSTIIPVLIEAIKEQQQIIESLKGEGKHGSCVGSFRRCRRKGRMKRRGT